jgi:hypothetical protein
MGVKSKYIDKKIGLKLQKIPVLYNEFFPPIYKGELHVKYLSTAPPLLMEVVGGFQPYPPCHMGGCWRFLPSAVSGWW